MSKKYSLIRWDLIDLLCEIAACYRVLFRLFRLIIIVFLRIFGIFGFISVQRMMGVGGGRGGVDLCKWGDVIFFASNFAFISKDFFDFLPKSKKISLKDIRIISQKRRISNRRDLIKFFFSNNCALFLSSFWLFRPKIFCVF